MSDIVKRLREDASELDFDPVSELLLEAAASIEELTTALEKMLQVCPHDPANSPRMFWRDYARVALSKHRAGSKASEPPPNPR